MKIWLNKLKPGERFWARLLDVPVQYEVIGPDNNPNFKMKRVKLKIISGISKEVIENIGELADFVNHYVYDNELEALNEILDYNLNKIEQKEKDIIYLQNYVESMKKVTSKLKQRKKELENKL